jgi:hypothetical protein
MISLRKIKYKIQINKLEHVYLHVVGVGKKKERFIVEK